MAVGYNGPVTEGYAAAYDRGTWSAPVTADPDGVLLSGVVRIGQLLRGGGQPRVLPDVERDQLVGSSAGGSRSDGVLNLVHLVPVCPLLGGGLRLPRLGLPRLGLPRGEARLPRISLGLLGPGPKPGPGLFSRRDLRLEPGAQLGLVPLGVLAGLRHLLLRGLAHPVQLRPS